MKLGKFTRESLLEYRQKATGQLCQRPDGTVYGIPEDRECVIGKPISEPPEEDLPVEEEEEEEEEEEQIVDQERQSLLKAAIERVKQSGEQFQQLKDALARNIDERLGQREQQPVNFEDLIYGADETFSENFSRIDQAASELGDLGDIGARIFAYEVALLEYEGNPEVEDHIRGEIEQLQNSFDSLNSVIQEEFNNIFNSLLQRGDPDLARENANNTLIDLPEDHPFSEEDYRKQLETLYALANNSVSSLGEVFYDGEERTWAYPPRNIEEDGEVYEFVGGINTGLSDDWDNQNASFWHEFGHHIEFSNQDLAAAMRDWVLSRATSQTPVSLNELTGSEYFEDTEVALPGNFTHPYVAKIYEDDAYIITEALAMGLQTFTNPSSMYNLYERDPEYFKLIVGSLLNL